MNGNLSDDDEIIEEIPVYISKTLSDQLYIFQYPNKRTEYNFDNADVVKSCLKPLSEDVKIDFALNTSSAHYDMFKGEQFAIAADGQKNSRSDRPSFRNDTMDRQSYVSTKPKENINKFSYFDKSDQRRKAEQKAENEADMDEEEPTQITVKFARQGNENVRKAKEKSFHFLSQKNADDAWCEMMWYPRHSHQAELERQKLFTSLSLNNEKYLKSLIPLETSKIDTDSLLPTNVISMTHLKHLPTLSHQIRVLLTDAKVVKFDHLMKLLSGSGIEADEDQVLRTLPLVGTLIKGNWVVASENLYPPESVSSINGVPAEFMSQARDYILYQFSKTDYISRQKIIADTQLPPEEVKNILLIVAKVDRSRSKWTLLQPPDVEFEQKHQTLKQKQDMYWHAKELKFQDMDKSKKARKKSIRDSNAVEIVDTTK